MPYVPFAESKGAVFRQTVSGGGVHQRNGFPFFRRHAGTICTELPERNGGVCWIYWMTGNMTSFYWICRMGCRDYLMSCGVARGFIRSYGRTVCRREACSVSGDAGTDGLFGRLGALEKANCYFSASRPRTSEICRPGSWRNTRRKC